jgi:hypothetical protein
MTEIIKFKDNATGKLLGKSRQINIPQKGDTVYIDNNKYSVERVVWIYSDPKDNYPEDPLTYEDMYVFLNFVVGFPKNKKNCFSDKGTEQK